MTVLSFRSRCSISIFLFCLVCFNKVNFSQYSVEIFPLVAHGFAPALKLGVEGDPSGQVLASHNVEIATLHSPGTPLPVPFTKPPISRKSNSVYENSKRVDRRHTFHT